MPTGEGKGPFAFPVRIGAALARFSGSLRPGARNHPIGPEGETQAPSDTQKPVCYKPLLKGCFCQSSAETRTGILYSVLIPRGSSTEPFTPWASQLVGHLEPKSLYLGSSGGRRSGGHHWGHCLLCLSPPGGT